MHMKTCESKNAIICYSNHWGKCLVCYSF